MTGFSANLGFLWADQPLPDAVRLAHDAGFQAVECHWPYDVPVSRLRNALRETGLQMLGINTTPGQLNLGEFGLCAVPGRVEAARASIDQALNYAAEVGARAVHVMAGNASGQVATDTFLENLVYASRRASQDGIDILIEPLNQFDVPAYFLKTTEQACEIIGHLNLSNVRLMFDCYHVARTHEDILPHLEASWDAIGHIQFAGVPDRGRPDQGLVDYRPILREINARGWTRPLGAEYKPHGPTEESLGWISELS